MKRTRLSAIAMLAMAVSLNSQNLLDSTTWRVGSGAAPGFVLNGSEAENSREWGPNHIGESVILWKATPDGNSDPDGGFRSDWIPASHNTSYQFSIWIKKTNSRNGTTYFGFYANHEGSLQLDGTYKSSPYFWSGDLPQLNRWYLLVGYVHSSQHADTTHTGGIYDGVTGEKVATITDYKLQTSVTAIVHRAYLYHDQNPLDHQYFYAPRIDPMTGQQPTIAELLGTNTDSKLSLFYDAAGNQVRAFYCGDPEYCTLARPEAKKTITYAVDADKHKAIEPAASVLVKRSQDTDLRVYPNPTAGQLTLVFGPDLFPNIDAIQLYSINSRLLTTFKPDQNPTDLDLSHRPAGVYLLHIHVHDGAGITRKIIKK